MRTHLACGTRTYRIWASMVWRCRAKSGTGFRDYASRGVRVCDRWRRFENFREDMGECPSDEHTIDRRDNSRGYEPDNCRWATTLEQQRNKTTNVRLTLDGETRCITEWAEITGLSLGAIQGRIRRGWSVERTLGSAPRKQQFGQRKHGNDMIPATLAAISSETVFTAKSLAAKLEIADSAAWNRCATLERHGFLIRAEKAPRSPNQRGQCDVIWKRTDKPIPAQRSPIEKAKPRRTHPHLTTLDGGAQ